MALTKGEESRPESMNFAAAGRKLEILLDYLLSRTASASHLMDPDFQSLLSEDELHLRKALDRLAESARSHAAKTPPGRKSSPCSRSSAKPFLADERVRIDLTKNSCRAGPGQYGAHPAGSRPASTSIGCSARRPVRSWIWCRHDVPGATTPPRRPRQRRQQRQLRDLHAQVVMLLLEAERAGHAAAAGVEHRHVQAGTSRSAAAVPPAPSSAFWWQWPCSTHCLRAAAAAAAVSARPAICSASQPSARWAAAAIAPRLGAGAAAPATRRPASGGSSAPGRGSACRRRRAAPGAAAAPATSACARCRKPLLIIGRPQQDRSASSTA